jgi:DDE family transposase
LAVRVSPNAGIGYCASKDIRYAGYKTATIVAPCGVIEDFVTGSAAPHDAPYGEALLGEEGVGDYLGDKGFIFKPEVREELEAQGVHLITPKRSNMKQTNTKAETKLLKRYRRIVETVNGQLTEHFSFNHPGGKSERGLLSRLLYKLAAHTFGLAILRDYHLPPMQLDLLVGA